jgi:hypothetical protein
MIDSFIWLKLSRRLQTARGIRKCTYALEKIDTTQDGIKVTLTMVPNASKWMFQFIQSNPTQSFYLDVPET